MMASLIKEQFMKFCNFNRAVVSRAICYMIERYLGEYTCLRHEQIQWDIGLERQSLVVHDVNLKRKAVNDVVKDYLPIEFVEGFLGTFSIVLPALECNVIPTEVEVKDVDITIRPKALTHKAAQLLEMMSASMVNSMDSSLRFAEQTMKDDIKENATSYLDPSSKIEAITWMADQIEKVKTLIHVVVTNITIRMEVVEDDKLVGLEIHIDRLEYFDDQVTKAKEGDSKEGPDLLMAWLTKNVQIQGFTFSLDHEPVPHFPGPMPDSTGTSPSELYVSALEEAMEGVVEPPQAIPVPIATFSGRSDIKVKVKGKEMVEGPKIEASAQFGAFHALFSPKQLEMLIKVLSSFAMPPETSSERESRQAGALNKRMSAEDYARVGQVLEHDMRSGNFEDVTEPYYAEDCNYLATGDPMFHTMETSPTAAAVDMNISMSSLDSASTLSTVPSSATAAEQRRKEKAAQKSRESAARAASEATANRNNFQLTVATVSVCLLHEEVQEQGGQEWVERMRELSATYFQGLRHISTAGQVLSLKELRDRISEIVPRDHLGLLCKPVSVSVCDKTVRSVQSMKVDMKIHQAELVECLFGSNTQGSCFHEAPVRVPQYCEILTFRNAHTAGEGEHGASVPCSLDNRPPAINLQAWTNSKTGPHGHTCKETKVKLCLGELVTEVDITLQDRLSTLLTTLTTPKTSSSSCSQPLINMDSHFGFNEAMEDVMQSNNAIDFDLTCHRASARIRFPIPDLRPPNQHAPREWWGRNLHKESLLLEIEELCLLKYSSPEQPSSTPEGVQVMCNKLEVYFQEDFNKTPRLFGSIMQGTGDEGENFNRPRVVIKSFPPVGSSLMDTQEEFEMEQSIGGLGSLDESDFTRPGSTPFTLKKEILHGSKAFEGDDDEGFDSMFERVAPGNKEETLKFMDVAMANTSLLVEITAPKVLAVLHDKQFVELLYNRINNDLLLWQPQSPSPPETFASGQSLNIQPQYLHPDMLKSFYEPNDSDSDEELASTTQPLTKQNTSFRQPSDLCLSVNIGEGKVFTCVPVREEDGKVREGVHGELALLAKDATMFVSVGHEGNPDLRYVTINANRAHLLHAGSVRDGQPPVSMDQLDTLTFDSQGCFEHMHSRIIRSEPSVPVVPLTDVGTGDMSEDMVAVAIRIEVDNWNNNKYFRVAAGIRGATLRHEKHLEGEGWIPQIMDLVNLTDYPIEGYVMPQVLTDLNIGLIGCAVDYRPKNFELMALRSLLTVQKFNLAVNLNTDTKYTTMKLLFDEVNLWLSDKDLAEVNVDRDYLCIGHVGLLEVGLRLGQAIEKGSKTLLWFGNNRTDFRFCSDSCAAFIHLLDHFINDRDLAKPEDAVAVPSEELQTLNLDDRTEAQNLHVQESIADALLEQRTPASPNGSPGKDDSRPLYFIPLEEVPQPSAHPVVCGRVSQSDMPALMTVSVEDDEEDFTIINEPGMGIAPKDGKPVIRFYSDPQEFPNLGRLPKAETNSCVGDLKTPAGWPVAEFKCVLRELNLDICIYDGHDFGTKTVCKEEKTKKKEESIWKTMKEAKKKEKVLTKMWKGGADRRNDIMVKLSIYKFRMQYEKYNEMEEKSRRLVVVARKVEVEDHLEVSPFNKFLYWPSYNVSHDGSNMVRLKMVWERPDDRYSTEEVSVRLTMQSIKCHINQNTLLFIQRFFSNLSEDSSSECVASAERDPSPSPSHTPRRKKSVSAERAPIFKTEGGEPKEEQWNAVDDSLMHFGDTPSGSQVKPQLDRPPRIDVEPEDNPMFFKSFIMTRDTVVIVDYTGTGAGICASDIKTMASTAIQGVLRLENVPLTLKQVELHRGYKGVAKLLEALLKEWEHDITHKQMTSVVGGIGPFSIFKTLVQGLLDFIRLPVEQYQKDGRVWRGFQKGALSLKTATQTALLDLLKKVIDSIMVCSSICFDVLSSSKNPNRIRELSKTPKDLREGMSGAVQVFKEGISGTLRDLARDASQQREQKGLPGALGYLMKNVPAAVCVMPVQVLSAGADQCVTGIRHEVRPDLLKEAEEKYKELN